jgi:hypothetical protein
LAWRGPEATHTRPVVRYRTRPRAERGEARDDPRIDTFIGGVSTTNEQRMTATRTGSGNA